MRSLFLFEKLTDDQLARLCQEGHVEIIESGQVFAEGDPAACLYVLIEGEIVTSRRVSGDDVQVSRTNQRGVYSGAYTAYLGDRVPQIYQNSLRVTMPSRFYVMGAECFSQIMNEWFPMPVHLLEGLFIGGQRTREAIGQRERLLALGSLTAGLTHELNNPAAAAVSATSALRERVAGMRSKLKMLAKGKYPAASWEALVDLQQRAVERVAKAPKLDPIETSDAEDAVSDWLEDHGCGDAWQLAPVFVQAGLDPEWLDKVFDMVGEEMIEPALRWLNYTVETELLMNEIEDSTTRVSTLVGAAKQYSQLDRAPYQVVDVHELLSSTLLMMSAKLNGITVVKQYDKTLPKIPAYAAELNQVWTNLIDNAAQAMNGTGTLTITTSLDDDCVLVEIGDTGPGIPADIQQRIFEPFFTTKPVGEGTGLGLDIAWRIVVNKHHGDVSVESVPGDTRFQVRLPIQPQNQENPEES
ncbi:MAG TPA: ATP-binding protein [Trebonia sp.]|nr:ATP-binding protein [Trebonia sp.]